MTKDTQSGQQSTGFSASWVKPSPTNGYAELAKEYRQDPIPPRIVEFNGRRWEEVRNVPPYENQSTMIEVASSTSEKGILPTDYDARKQMRLWEFFFNYFPLAWLEVYKVSEAGNKQHEIGKELRWDRSKSVDQLNTAFRHLFDHGVGTVVDSDGTRHLAKAIWRLMAQLQLDVEKDRK